MPPREPLASNPVLDGASSPTHEANGRQAENDQAPEVLINETLGAVEDDMHRVVKAEAHITDEALEAAAADPEHGPEILDAAAAAEEEVTKALRQETQSVNSILSGTDGNGSGSGETSTGAATNADTNTNTSEQLVFPNAQRQAANSQSNNNSNGANRVTGAANNGREPTFNEMADELGAVMANRRAQETPEQRHERVKWEREINMQMEVLKMARSSPRALEQLARAELRGEQPFMEAYTKFHELEDKKLQMQYEMKQMEEGTYVETNEEIPESLKEFGEVPEGYVQVQIQVPRSIIQDSGGGIRNWNKLSNETIDTRRLMNEANPDGYARPNRSVGEVIIASGFDTDIPDERTINVSGPNYVTLDLMVNPENVLVVDGEHFTRAYESRNVHKDGKEKEHAKDYWDSAITLAEYNRRKAAGQHPETSMGLPQIIIDDLVIKPEFVKLHDEDNTDKERRYKEERLQRRMDRHRGELELVGNSEQKLWELARHQLKQKIQDEEILSVTEKDIANLEQEIVKIEAEHKQAKQTYDQEQAELAAKKAAEEEQRVAQEKEKKRLNPELSIADVTNERLGYIQEQMSGDERDIRRQAVEFMANRNLMERIMQATTEAERNKVIEDFASTSSAIAGIPREAIIEEAQILTRNALQRGVATDVKVRDAVRAQRAAEQIQYVPPIAEVNKKEKDKAPEPLKQAQDDAIAPPPPSKPAPDPTPPPSVPEMPELDKLEEDAETVEVISARPELSTAIRTMIDSFDRSAEHNLDMQQLYEAHRKFSGTGSFEAFQESVEEYRNKRDNPETVVEKQEQAQEEETNTDEKLNAWSRGILDGYVNTGNENNVNFDQLYAGYIALSGNLTREQFEPEARKYLQAQVETREIQAQDRRILEARDNLDPWTRGQLQTWQRQREQNPNLKFDIPTLYAGYSAYGAEDPDNPMSQGEFTQLVGTATSLTSAERGEPVPQQTAQVNTQASAEQQAQNPNAAETSETSETTAQEAPHNFEDNEMEELKNAMRGDEVDNDEMFYTYVQIRKAKNKQSMNYDEFTNAWNEANGKTEAETTTTISEDVTEQATQPTEEEVIAEMKEQGLVQHVVDAYDEYIRNRVDMLVPPLTFDQFKQEWEKK